MPRADGLLSHEETANILGVTAKHLYDVVRQGRLIPVDTGSRLSHMWYRGEEVYALLELRTRRLDLPTAMSTAIQAHALSRSTQSRLDKICTLLGLDVTRLSQHEDAMHALHTKALALAKDMPDEAKEGFVMEWSATLNAIDESYLRLLEEYTMDVNPWEPYMLIANILFSQLGAQQLTEPDLHFSYACLSAARRNLRHVAYFYVRTRRGNATAEETFGENVDEDIIALLYPTTLA